MTFDQARYAAYVAAYNRQDWAAMAESFYTADVVLEGDDLRLQGADVTRFLTDLHQGVRETLHPEQTYFGPSGAAVELVAEFTAEVDLPSHLLGPMRQGDVVRSQWAAFYTFRGDKIARLSLYRWRPRPHKLEVWPPPAA